MNQFNQSISRSEESILATNKVLKNTYMLLAMTLIFSAGTAGLSMSLNLPHPGMIITLVGYIGLLWLTSTFRNSGLGIVCVFALTGFMGMTLGPILNMYLQAYSNGHELIMTSLGGTGVIFLGLSGFIARMMVHAVTLPIEFDASFSKALPLLREGKYISQSNEKAVSQILKAASLTYVSAALADILNLGRWIVILSRR